jgi:hypothetical protein
MEVEDFIYNLEGNQRKIANFLHQKLTYEYGLEPKIRFKIPFYFKKSWICYINPVKNEGVELAFIRGNELSNPTDLFDFRGRKQVMGMIFYNLENTSWNLVEETLIEALVLDETVRYTVRKN